MTDPRKQLIQDATYFYGKGWMAGTGGNLSAKADDSSFWITASGMAKGALTEKDFVRVGMDGNLLEAAEGRKPSAETSIHKAIYQSIPEAHACYHVHTVEAAWISRTAKDSLPLPAVEMIKGIGIWDEAPNALLPLFANHHEVARIAEDIAARFSKRPTVPALLVVDHGVTVWGKSQQEARNYIEVMDYLFRYMALTARNGGS